MVLDGARSQVTVLFCDLRGFTRMSERMSPEAVVMLLNEFYTLMIETVFKYDGTLDKFLGDAVMAVFGAPIAPHPDHTARALRTALEMQVRLTEWNDARRADGREVVAAGIGVTVGQVVAGTVGTEDRMEYTVIGDSVNLAARLESMAKGGQVLISEAAYAVMRDMVLATSLGRIKVKGKEEEVEVYEVHGLRDAP
jgi:adenylate cyclase